MLPPSNSKPPVPPPPLEELSPHALDAEIASRIPAQKQADSLVIRHRFALGFLGFGLGLLPAPSLAFLFGNGPREARARFWNRLGSGLDVVGFFRFVVFRGFALDLLVVRDRSRPQSHRIFGMRARRLVQRAPSDRRGDAGEERDPLRGR